MKLEFESNTSAQPYVGSNYANDVESKNDPLQVSQMLLAGIKAAQEGNRSQARQLLVQVTEAEPDNETAWLWMASISEYPEELIIFLNNVLSINPANKRALEWMKATKSLLAGTFVERGRAALSDTNSDLARQCFWQAIAHDDQNETAWLSLASTTDSTETKITYLQKVININPENEAAKASLKAARNQATESLLRQANSAAVAGRREEAREMLQEVLDHSPERAEAWILKSYLAESFSEKVTSFEKILAFDPENEMAISGLASLRATMANAEAKKAEQAALIAEFEKTAAAAQRADLNEQPKEEIVSAVENDAEANSPTQKLEFPADYASAEYHRQNIGNFDVGLADEPLKFSSYEGTEQNEGNFYQELESNFAQMISEEKPSELNDSAEIDFMNYNPFENQSSAPNNKMTGNLTDSYEKPRANPFGDFYTESKKEIYSLESEHYGAAEHSSKSSVEFTACPFCRAENESSAFVCGSCRTILTLSDLEMLLAHADTDQEVLRQAVERMENEKNFRPFSTGELKNLAIGQINLKNLRQGVIHLQKAALMNPNDVMLASQINSLKIRLSEIEQHENNHSQIPKGRRILIVDDSATVRKLISSKLEKSGHDVVSAVDGIDAMEKIKEFIPDLILLDIMMPQLDGYQVCKLIRANEATKDVPIVMISGKDSFFDKVRGRLAGTTGYITKPFGPETLMKTVETYISHHGEIITDGEEMSDQY